LAGERQIRPVLCLKVLPTRQHRHQRNGGESNPGTIHNLCLRRRRLFLLLRNPLGIPYPPFLLFLDRRLAGLLRRSAGVQVGPFAESAATT
jgi:hypothetical protein